jgi:hypothetical protein
LPPATGWATVVVVAPVVPVGVVLAELVLFDEPLSPQPAASMAPAAKTNTYRENRFINPPRLDQHGDPSTPLVTRTEPPRASAE